MIFGFIIYGAAKFSESKKVLSEPIEKYILYKVGLTMFNIGFFSLPLITISYAITLIIN